MKRLALLALFGGAAACAHKPGSADHHTVAPNDEPPMVLIVTDIYDDNYGTGMVSQGGPTCVIFYNDRGRRGPVPETCTPAQVEKADAAMKTERKRYGFRA